MPRWLKIVAGLAILIVGGGYAALKIGGPDLIYPRVSGTNYGPTSIAFEDTDPGPTIGGTITLGRAPDENGIDVYMVHWGLEVDTPGTHDDATTAVVAKASATRTTSPKPNLRRPAT